MNEDLGDVGLAALEALEAQDEQEQENSAPEDVEEKGDTTEGEKTTNKEKEEVEDTSDGGEDEETSETDDNGETSEESSEEGESESEEKAPENKELSDEEFEELAKKRGYSKAKTEEETRADEEKAKSAEKLLECPEEVDKDKWEHLPLENKITYNSLPYLIAEGKNGAIRVKTPEQLPEDFEFKSQKAMMSFYNDLQAQENRATQIMQDVKGRMAAEAKAVSERQEAAKVIGEIDSLQKSGALPKPKAKSGTKEFDDDPAVLLINKVLGYRAMMAEKGAKLSVRDSLVLYKSEHPEDFVQKEAKGDVERRNIAKKVAGNSKATSAAVNGNEDSKPHYYRPGMSTEDVLDAVLNEMD